MTLTDYVKAAHENAVEKGFYDCNNCGRNCLLSKVDTKCSNKNVSEMLMLIVSELGEAVEADRKGHTNPYDSIKEYEKNKDPVIYNQYIKGSFQEELADVFIRLCDMCGYLGIDLEKFVNMKMEYNKTREHKHGKNY